MKRFGILSVFVAATLPLAANARQGLGFMVEPPLHNSGISGNMVANDLSTEFLTPIGIVDNLPEPEPFYATLESYATIEPSAGPISATETISATEATSETLPEPEPVEPPPVPRPLPPLE